MGIEGTMREFISNELAGIYTISMVIVESVDEQTRRCEVSLKQERNIIIDNVPIAAPFAGDSVGVVWPVESGNEGLVLHPRQPIDDALEELGHIEAESDRRFQSDDAVLFPLIWNDEQTVPDHEPGEFLIAHQSGTLIRVKPDGTAAIQHANGNEIRMNGADGSVVLGDPSSAAPLLNENAVIEYEDTGDTSDGSAGSTTKTATISDPGTENVDGA